MASSAPPLPEQVRPHVDAHEWKQLGPLLNRLERNRKIMRRFEELREKGRKVSPAFEQIAREMPFDISPHTVEAVIYKKR